MGVLPCHVAAAEKPPLFSELVYNKKDRRYDLLAERLNGTLRINRFRGEFMVVGVRPEREIRGGRVLNGWNSLEFTVLTVSQGSRIRSNVGVRRWV